MPHTLCFGQTRKVSWQATISVGGALYSVPSTLVDERVWARVDGSQLVVVHADSPRGPSRGRPPRADHTGAARRPRARSADEAAFLALGPGAEAWLLKAAATGAARVRRKMSEAVDLAKLHGSESIERALAGCADAGRFGDGDLAAILAHQACAEVIEFARRAWERR